MWAMEFFIDVSSFLGTIASSTVLFKILSLNFTVFSVVLNSCVMGSLAGLTPSFKMPPLTSCANTAGENNRWHTNREDNIFLNIE